MPRQSATDIVRFAGPAGRPLAVDFRGGRLTSDGGLPWLAEADDALGLCAALAAVIPEFRSRRGRHDRRARRAGIGVGAARGSCPRDP